jgi:hypothetical protein
VDNDFIDLPDDATPATPPPATHSPAAPGRKRIFAPTPAKVNRYERRDRERDDRRGYPLPAHGEAAAEAPGRVPPHSVEAEEQLLSACLLDGGGVVQKCLDGKIRAESFYVPANRVIYGKLLQLHAAKLPIDLSVLAEKLKESRQLDELGGYAYLTRISGRIPTTAGASFFIAKVRELARLRDIIRAATDTVERCYGFSGPEDFPSIIAPLSVAWEEDVSLMELAEARRVRHDKPPEKAQAILTIANRPMATQGNLMAVIAQAKAGKTTSIGGAMTAILKSDGRSIPAADTLGWEAAPIGNRVLIYIDTELSPPDHWTAVDRFMRRAHHDKHPEWLWNYCLTGWKPEDMKTMLGALVARVQAQGREVYAIFLDGVADFAKSVNDEEECGELVAALHLQAIQAKCPIICVMHRNEGDKADTAARGHLGKQLARKAETNLRLEQRDGISYVFAEKNRGAPLSKAEGPAFRWHDPSMMHVSIPQEEKERFLAEMEESNAPRRRSSGGGGGGGEGKAKNIKRTYTEQEFLAQFPFGIKAAQPLPVIRKKAVSNLCISESKFSDERFNMMTAGTIQKVTMPNGEDRYFR